MVEQSLIDAVKAQKPQAFQEMYEACIRYVYSIVIRYVTNDSDQPDVVQEIFARVFLKIDTYHEEKGEFKFWLRRLSINQCIKHYHNKKQQLDTMSLEGKVLSQMPAKEEHSGLSKMELLQFLKSMPSGYREIFMLVVIDEYSHKEVGEMLKISPETSRSQLHRAKKWLKEKLSPNTLKLMVNGN